MIYPENFEIKTGFDQIRKMVKEYCISTLGQYYAHKMRYNTSFNTIQLLLNQTEEFRQILITNENFPATNYYNPFDIFDRLKPAGTFAEAGELGEIRQSLKTISGIITFLQAKKDDDQPRFPILSALCSSIYIEPGIITEIDRIIDDKSEIRSNASENLSGIRRKKTELLAQAGRKINQIMAQAKRDGWVAQDVELAFRGSRQVIPVTAAFKRKIKGFVHDQSATGQTVFLEPEEIFEINNEIRQLDIDERLEIIKILKGFGDYFRPFLAELTKAYHFLGKIDFIRAKARTALEMDAMKPILSSHPGINWIRAKHPLLWLNYKPQKKHVEPVNLDLNSGNKIMVISGPNAGGKSICLKTAGLIQYMLQCGLLVPMEDYSEAGIFHKIMIDIGDEQSLENDLSTYSSHLANMNSFLAQCDQNTLFLIDEFGAGTEPKIGGAIAEAILEKLTDQGAFGVVTTHYANLKILAGKKKGILNGSMLFDTKNMKPLYRLKTGNPGSSFAFEIARTMGLPENLLKKAERIAGEKHVDFDRQLQDLELKKLVLDEKEKQLMAGDSFLSELIEKYEKQNEELSLNKRSIINEAKAEAKKILADSNRIIEKTIREIKESAANKEKTKHLRLNLQDFIEKNQPDETFKPHVSKKKKKEAEKSGLSFLVIENSPIMAGDMVRMAGQDNIGEVIEAGDKETTVAFGSMLIKVSSKKLEKIKKGSLKHQQKKSTVKYDFDINQKASEFNPNLDIRGKKVDEALILSRRFIDDAMLLGMKQIKIVHGTGDGILREALRDYLRNLSEIKKARDEHPDRGGAGSTLIEIR